ncbi:DUF6327 family protein [Myroides sp. LJL119]
MIRKTYTSIDQINNDLNILRTKRDLHYQKIFRSVDVLKQELTPDHLLRSTLGSMVTYVKSSGNIQAFLITAILKKIFNRRKGA